MNCREVITTTVALCLTLAALGGFGGPINVCRVQAVDCLESWKDAAAGALAAAGLGGTLLAQIDGRRRRPDPEDPQEPPTP
ncbi:hypothetical protein LBMAG40_00740 [Cyanobium sp.]|nr:hypothetical protein LBMAG40_00740 [Cyanobium sp.]